VSFRPPGLLLAALLGLPGLYRVSGDEVVAVAPWETEPGAPPVLAYASFKSGRFGVLREEKGSFVLGKTLMGGAPDAVLRASDAGLSIDGRLAPRMATREEELVVDAGGVKLGATLMLPPGRGPFPAVVLVPAGALGRRATAIFPAFFASEGFAALAYDRRPTSPEATFETYAADALAAVQALRRRPDIDPARVGLWGHSQGGWLSLVAAAQASSRPAGVAFVIDEFGMLVPAWRQELYRVQAEAEADGVEPEAIAQALAFERRLMEVARTGAGWDALAASLQAGGKARWVDLVYAPRSLEQLQRVWRNDFSFDPRPYAARVKVPILALFGGLDRSTPMESAANLELAAREAGNTAVTIQVFPTADHGALDAVTGGNAELPSRSRFAPGFFEAIRRWLRALKR